MTYTITQLEEIKGLVESCTDCWWQDCLSIKRAEIVTPDGTYVGEVASNLDGTYEFRPVGT